MPNIKIQICQDRRIVGQRILFIFIFLAILFNCYIKISLAQEQNESATLDTAFKHIWDSLFDLKKQKQEKISHEIKNKITEEINTENEINQGTD